MNHVDFGLSCLINSVKDKTVQTLWYRAPEVVFKLDDFGPQIDMWSLGCIIYELFTGHVLFPVREEFTLLTQIINLLGPPPQTMFTNLRFARRYYRGVTHITQVTRVLPRKTADLKAVNLSFYFFYQQLTRI
jgi:serine/threonine protein kinase